MSTEQTLQFGKKPVRIVIADGDVWFAAKDLYLTQRRHTDKRHLSCFDRQHLRIHTFATENGLERLALVSSLGALTIATLLPTPADRMVDGWVRKQVELLGFFRPGLSLCADGTMPVRPKAAWASYSTWQDLKAANPNARRNPQVESLPELDDDDIPPPAQTDAQIMAVLSEALLASEDGILKPTPAKPRRKKR
jgi:hypothetical protein